MKHAITIRILTAAAVCIAAAQTASPASYIRRTETMRRAERAEQNGDRSELPFLEAVTLKEDADRLDRKYAAEAYLKIATFDESISFMRKLCLAVGSSSSLGYYVFGRFFDKARTEDKDADDATREKLYAFMLEIAQGETVPENAYGADFFLRERLPGYADSKQRATLTRFANTGYYWVTNTFNPIKDHFDKIPPSKRVDLRKRFPSLPPVEEPPEETPEPPPPGRTVSHYWFFLAALLTAATLTLLKRKGTRR